MQLNYHIQGKEFPPKYRSHQEPESFSSDVYSPDSFQQSKDFVVIIFFLLSLLGVPKRLKDRMPFLVTVEANK